MKLVTGGIVFGTLIVAYKAGIYVNATYKLKKIRRSKIVDFETYADQKKRVKEEKEK